LADSSPQSTQKYGSTPIRNGKTWLPDLKMLVAPCMLTPPDVMLFTFGTRFFLKSGNEQ